METNNPLMGKTIESVWMAEDNKAIKFCIKGGEEIIAKTDGDCCSDTWIESLEMPENMIGTVREAHDVDMPEVPGVNNEENYALTRFYGFRIVTERGISTMDYRNQSNGYYGGNLCWPVAEGEYDYFYGGMFGQNISKVFSSAGGTWRKIA